jgi:hypothetical protein
MPNKYLNGILVPLTEEDKAQRAQDELDWANGLGDRVRASRLRLLKRYVDPLAGNALRWAALTEEQRQAWSAYRQALLDVPQQAGFPYNVTWPEVPND